MSDLARLPVRGQPPGLVVPPARMAAWRDGRPLKRWRYVGLYGEDVMLCAARVRIGPLAQAFWATWDRSRLAGATTFRPGRVDLADGVLRAGTVDLRWSADGEAVEVTSRHGRSYIWTRKQPLHAEGTVDGRPVALRGLLDDSAGYHARATSWRWCAGVGETPGGAALAWNLVDGVHDAPTASERTVWVDGAARELPPTAFAADLSEVRGAGGALLRFGEEARRERSEHLGLVTSDYAQPFGTFSGSLAADVVVARGWGVMERHDVRW
ncbi:DUF2804 family protein [Baekduia soli]|uniref:DUF2804 family protein n=1 Tax=Baekduia soli TaxID=496014 RepID=A0A5B8UC40_9ACTN|nr:DUF2804 family protein [Baekduia soli]QEC50212.1 DUF2804 family protein [Baekduia soli]